MQDVGAAQHASERRGCGDLWHHDRQRLIGLLLLHLVDVIEQATHERAASRLDESELHTFVLGECGLPLLPCSAQGVSFPPVTAHMHRGHLLRDRAGIGQDALRRGVQACYWHDEAVVDVLRAH